MKRPLREARNRIKDSGVVKECLFVGTMVSVEERKLIRGLADHPWRVYGVVGQRNTKANIDIYSETP
jgi:hypothetical protein